MTSLFLAFSGICYVMSGFVCVAVYKKENPSSSKLKATFILLFWCFWLIREVEKEEEEWEDESNKIHVNTCEPDHCDLILRRAKTFANEGCYWHALNTLDRAIEMCPQVRDILLLKGAIFFQLKRYQEAYECYDRALDFQRAEFFEFPGEKSEFPKQRLGELLECAGLISREQLAEALEIQTKKRSLRLGKILAQEGWIRQETSNFFVEQFPILVIQKQDRPQRLGEYFRAAALLDDRQVETIIEEQSERGLLFGQIAVCKGWIQPKTVDFFVKQLQ